MLFLRKSPSRGLTATPNRIKLKKMKKHDAVYPGHPFVIATFIVKTFKNWNDATNRTKECKYTANALADIRIPGAGGCVHSALQFLRYVREDIVSYEKAVEYVNDVWKHTDNHGESNLSRWREGQAQANRLINSWKKPIIEWCKGFCCSTMQEQLVYECSQHGMGIQCPDVVLFASRCGYRLEGKNATYSCQFCPWCGSALQRRFWKDDQNVVWQSVWNNSANETTITCGDQERTLLTKDLHSNFTEIVYATV